MMMATIIRRRDTLSLIILNITPPEHLSFDMITILKSEQDLARIPVIVMSADRDKEAQCLRMGVYPDVDKTLDIERRFDHALPAAGDGSAGALMHMLK